MNDAQILDLTGFENNTNINQSNTEEIIAFVQKWVKKNNGQLKEENHKDGFDPSKRILCSDGACIGVVNDKGFCKVCGKPYKR